MSTTTLRDVLDTRSRDTNNGGTILEQVRRRLELVRGVTADHIDSIASENRGIRASEERMLDKARKLISDLEEREAELADDERRERLAARSRVETGQTGPQRSDTIGGAHTSAQTYHRGASSASFFKDLIYAQRGDADAADRLRTNNREVNMESRALGNSGAVGGSAGEFAPPDWIVSEAVKLARPGRVVADTFHREDMPAGVSSVNLPKILTGTQTGPQTTQNTIVPNVDMTTGALSAGIVTIAGGQTVSQQMLDQSPVRFDEIVLEDLASDYARQLGIQALTGSGVAGQLRGYLTAVSTSKLVWTSTAPTASGFYGRIAQLAGMINATRFRAPDTIAMAPRRWSWLCSFVDSTGRPLVTPQADGSFNSMANPDTQQGVGHVGRMLGMNVVTDPNIPLTLGTSLTEDVALVYVASDIWLWESGLRAEAFTSPMASSMGVFFRVYNYASLICERYNASLGQISGSGMVAPVFAG